MEGNPQHTNRPHRRQPYSSIYKKLLKVIPDLIRHIEAGKESGKSQMPPDSGFMDLYFNYLGRDRNRSYLIALSHYYEEHGDQVPDPDMQIRIYPELEEAEAMTIQDARRYVEVYTEENGKELVNLRQKKDLNQFLNFWLNNLIQQGHRIDLSKDDDTSADQEPSTDTENPNEEIATNGANENDGAINAGDPLANDQGVYTRETAGKNFEELPVPIPAGAKHKAEISLVKTSQGEYKFGLRVSRHYGDHAGVGFLPNISGEGYTSRQEALKAALLYIMEWLGTGGVNEKDKKRIETVRDAVKKLATVEQIPLEEASLQKEKTFPKTAVNEISETYWTLADEEYPVNKIYIGGVAYHEKRLRRFLLAKLAEQPIRQQLNIIGLLKRVAKERRPLESYDKSLVTIGKRGNKRKAALIRSYMDDMIQDNDTRTGTTHVLEFLMYQLLDDIYVIDEQPEDMPEKKKTSPEPADNNDASEAYWTPTDNAYPVNKISVNGRTYHQARLRHFILNQISKLSIKKQLYVADVLKKLFKERRPLESYNNNSRVPFTKLEDRDKIPLIRAYVDDVIIDIDLRVKVVAPVLSLLLLLVDELANDPSDPDPFELFKQPWQMSLREFKTYTEDYIRKFSRYPEVVWEVAPMLARYFPDSKVLLNDPPTVENGIKVVRAAHLLHIIKAISNKKELPPEALDQYADLIPMRSRRPSDVEYGFEDINLRSAGTFQELLEHTGLEKKWKECKSLNSSQPNPVTLYLWEGDGIRMITANNPLLNDGYASFVGLAGDQEKADKAAAFIEYHTESKRSNGLEYINFDNILCLDPDNPFLDPPDEPTSPTAGTEPESKEKEIQHEEKETTKDSARVITGTENLKKFAAFVSQYRTIDGYDNAEAKETFGRLGKKAFKELAAYLGLNPFDVHYNKAGIAVSGDLRVMGMITPEKGIYISFNKDGMTNGKVLYRSIEHMKDFRGGGNHYFQENDFAEPERIKENVQRLVMPHTPPQPIVTDQEEEANDVPVHEAVELYRSIHNGENIERLPELIMLLNTPGVRKEVKAFNLDLSDLLESSRFRESINVNIWRLIPDEYKKLRAVSPVKWEPDPADKGLRTIIGDFTGQDAYRPNLWGASFDAQGIVATDAHKLVFLNTPNVKKKGVFCVTKFCFKSMGKEGEDEAVINERFPDYVSVIPDRIKVTHTIHTDSLRLYCQAMLKARFNENRRMLFHYGSSYFIGMSTQLLESVATALARLGYSMIDIGFTAPNKPVLFTPAGKMKDLTTLTTPFALATPYLISTDENYQPARGEFYFSFTNETVYTQGVGETVSLIPGEPEAVQSVVEREDYLDRMIALMHERYAKDERVTKKHLMAIAAEAGVVNKGKIWEAAELSWLLWYRQLYAEKIPFDQRLARMIRFWNNVQPTYDYSDSSKEIYKQYSTPCPVGAIAAQYTGMDQARSIFEPSAGNGLLVVGAQVDKTHVNEIDPTRLASLKFQQFAQVTSLNAAKPFPDGMDEKYDVVVTNPPFARWEDDQYDKDQIIKKYFDNHVGLSHHLRLEHVMTGFALRCMKDEGRAVVIIMGHVYFGEDGLFAKYRPFFNWLYRHYYVDDIVNLNSFRLYNKQGTVEKVMMILIRGRKEVPEGVAPTKKEAPYLYDLVDSFEELWDRVSRSLSYSLDTIIHQLKTALAA